MPHCQMPSTAEGSHPLNRVEAGGGTNNVRRDTFVGEYPKVFASLGTNEPCAMRSDERSSAGGDGNDTLHLFGNYLQRQIAQP
jgi:hypothetical protein